MAHSFTHLKLFTMQVFEFSFSFKSQYRGASPAEQALRLFNGIFSNTLAALLHFGADQAISIALLALREFRDSNPEFWYSIPEWRQDAESGVHEIRYTSHNSKKYIFEIDEEAQRLTITIPSNSSLFFEVAALAIKNGHGVLPLQEKLNL